MCTNDWHASLLWPIGPTELPVVQRLNLSLSLFRTGDPPSAQLHIYKLQLFVAGDTPNSAQALANIRALCQVHLLDCHELEVIDVFREPDRAVAGGIFVTPTLVKLTPGGLLKIVGTLGDTAAVLAALNLPQPPP